MWRVLYRRHDGGLRSARQRRRRNVGSVSLAVLATAVALVGVRADATLSGQIDSNTINAWPAGTSATVDAGHWQAAEVVVNHTESITGVVVAVTRHDDGCSLGSTCTPLGDLTVALWTVGANGLPGRAVTSVTIPRTTIPNDTSSPALVEANVTESTLEEGDSLYLVMSTSSGTGGESYLWAQYDNVSPQTTAQSGTQGADWSNSTVTQETASGYPQVGFQDYYSPAAPPMPGVVDSSTVPPSSVTLTTSANPSIYGQPVTFTATVSPVDAESLVYVTDNSEAIHGCYGVPPQLVNGVYQVSCTVSVFGTGTRVVQAEYADFHYANSYASVNQLIAPAPTRLSAAPAVITKSPAAAPLFTLEATLTRAGDGQAVLGQQVTFTAGATTLCSALTNPLGVATCGGLTQAAEILQSGGYTASFAGSNDYASSSGNGALIG